MNVLERIRDDKIAIGTCGALAVSLLAKLLQTGILNIMTDYYPLTSENIWNTILGMLPSLLLLVYMLVFYKTEKLQLLLPCTFLVQLAITAVYAWSDYQAAGGLDASLIGSNLCWIIYYAFLFIVTYRGFENVLLLRIVIGAMSLYSMFSSVVTWITLVRLFPEEIGMIVSQAIALIGFLGYYLATFLIVPKVAKK